MPLHRAVSLVPHIPTPAHGLTTDCPALPCQAKTAKVVRTIIEIVNAVPDALDVQIGLCRQVVAWCTAEKRTFLRHRIQSKLAGLLFRDAQYQEALTLINKLIKELKKLDDKQMLVETHLIEARIQHALRNLPKDKAALTLARTAGNAVYARYNVPLGSEEGAEAFAATAQACVPAAS